MKIESTCFLCGHFSSKIPLSSTNLPIGWSVQNDGAEQVKIMSRYFYSEFVDFFAKDVVTFKKEIGGSFFIRANEDSGLTRVDIVNCVVYQMPMDMVVFYIQVRFPEVDHQDMVTILKELRRCGRYKFQRVGDFISIALDPMFDIYQQCGGKEIVKKNIVDSLSDYYDYSFLVEQGNKFKLFQITSPNVIEADRSFLRKFIYCLGTLSSFSDDIEEDYIDLAMRKGYVSVYKDWSLLALLDSVTILSVSHPIGDKLFNTWVNSYFGKIFIYELYRKCFLYRLNYKFRHYKLNSDLKKLQEEMRAFERNYAFGSISYNFLPKMIDTVLESVLESKAEEDDINTMINREVLNRDEKREVKTNRLLLFLSILTVFSAIWDLLSLVKDSLSDFVFLPVLISSTILLLAVLLFLLCRSRWK